MLDKAFKDRLAPTLKNKARALGKGSEPFPQTLDKAITIRVLSLPPNVS
jgi:hypothetical protein